MLIALSGTAFAENTADIVSAIDLSSVQRAADAINSGIDVRSAVMDIASGETSLDGEYLLELFGSVKNGFLSDVVASMGIFLAPLFIAGVYVRLFPSGKNACELICGCAAAAAFAPITVNAMNEAKELISGIADVTEAVIPVVTALSAMGGGTASAALITPAAALLAEVLIGIVSGWGMCLTGAAAACACADSIGSAVRFDRLFSFIRRTVQTGAGLMLAMFAGILKVQGMLGKSFDSAAVKTARFAVDKLVPAVGGGIADTMDAAISSVLLIRSAVGVTGLLILVSACAVPVVNISASLIGVRLAGAVAGMLPGSRMNLAADEFGDVLRLLVVMCMTAVTLGLVLIGSAIGAGGSITG